MGDNYFMECRSQSFFNQTYDLILTWLSASGDLRIDQLVINENLEGSGISKVPIKHIAT